MVAAVTVTRQPAADIGERSPRVREWPAWAPPAAAVGAWNALQGALVLVGWRVACQADPEVWWRSGSSSAAVADRAAAVEACGWCPVVGLCREYAVAADEVEGVWGGTTPAERRVLAGRRR